MHARRPTEPRVPLLALGPIVAAIALAGCGGGVATHGAATASRGTGAGSFVFAQLKYNEQIFSTQGTVANGPMFDHAGDALDAADPGVPNQGKPGIVQFTANDGTQVPFQFPGTTGKTSEMVGNGSQLKIAVPSGQYSELYFLESTGNGTPTGAAIDLSLTYADGSSQKTTIMVTDWDHSQNIVGNEVVAFTTADQIDANGNSGSGTHAVYVDQVPAQPTKQLQDVGVFAEVSDNVDVQFNILALTLRKA